MDNYVCKIATSDEIAKKYDYEMEYENLDRFMWTFYKERAVERNENGSVITYHGLINNEVICECKAALDKSIFDNYDGILDDNTAYLFAFRTKDEYQNQGYFSKLFKYMIKDIMNRGYEFVTVGVEPTEKRNKLIYSKYGFTEYIKGDKQRYPDGSSINVEYYKKILKKQLK